MNKDNDSFAENSDDLNNKCDFSYEFSFSLGKNTCLGNNRISTFPLLGLPNPEMENMESMTNEFFVQINNQPINVNSDKEKNFQKNTNKNFLGKKTGEKSTDYTNNLNCRTDNVIRKCKNIILNSLLIFINQKIKNLYNNNIGRGLLVKQFKSLNQKNKSSTHVKHMQEYLNKTLKEILSEDISHYPFDFNRNLVNKLLDEEDIEKRIYFKSLFDLSFLQCLKHFRGDEVNPNLSGMSLMNQELNNFTDKDLRENLEPYFNEFETRINERKSRKSKHISSS
jgi:hypothetical protein